MTADKTPLEDLIERRDRILARLIGMRLYDVDGCLDRARSLVWVKAFRPWPLTADETEDLGDPLLPILDDLGGLSFYDATRVIETARLVAWQSAFPGASHAAPEGAALN